MTIKHTVLATPGIVVLVSFFGLHFIALPPPLIEIASMLMCGVLTYAALFYVIFGLFTKSGDRYDSFMPVYFRKMLAVSKW